MPQVLLGAYHTVLCSTLADALLYAELVLVRGSELVPTEVLLEAVSAPMIVAALEHDSVLNLSSWHRYVAHSLLTSYAYYLMRI